MKTRHLLVGGALALGVITVGVGTRHVLAQSVLVTGAGARTVLAQQGAAATAATPAITMRSNSIKGRATEAGRMYETTMQGNVVINSSESALVLTTTSNAFVVGPTNKGMHGNTVHIPMDLATLRVSVTPSGTIFEDQHGNKLTVEAQTLPK